MTVRDSAAPMPDPRRERLADSFRHSGERLVRELGPELLRRAEAAGLDTEESREIVQDCLLDLWLRQPDPALVGPWLFRIVRWRALDRRRADARRRAAEARAADRSSDDCQVEPEDRFAVQEAVAALPARSRRALRARFLDDATLAEAAARAGWRPASAKNLFARALARVGILLGVDACGNRRRAGRERRG